MTRLLLSSVAAAAVLAGASTSWAQTEIQWWHAMGGNLGETVNALADGFNKSQGDYKVVPVYKGEYTETLTAAIAAFRAKQAPHIVQVFEVGTASMMAAKGAVYPVYQPMASSCPCLSTAQRRCSIGTRNSWRRRGWTPTSRRQPGRSWARWPRRRS